MIASTVSAILADSTENHLPVEETSCAVAFATAATFWCGPSPGREVGGLCGCRDGEVGVRGCCGGGELAGLRGCCCGELALCGCCKGELELLPGGLVFASCVVAVASVAAAAELVVVLAVAMLLLS